MKLATLHIITLSALLALPLFANEARVHDYKAQLRSARPAELPAAAARLVEKQNADAADTVTAAIALNSAAAPLVVGSVAKAAPQSASAAAAAALRAQPQSPGAITKAAASAAPTEAAAIVTANCRVQPVSFYRIGVAAAEGAPKASEQIIPAITAAIPALKPVIARAQADLKKENRTASLAWVLKHAENVLLAMSRETKTTPEALLAQESESTMTAKVASLSSTIVQGPPFVPGGGTPGEVPVSGTTETSYTNRIYSAP